jgi:hypothetical protein
VFINLRGKRDHVPPVLPEQTRRACHHFILHPFRTHALELLDIETSLAGVTVAVCLHLGSETSYADRRRIAPAHAAPPYVGLRRVLRTFSLWDDIDVRHRDPEGLSSDNVTGLMNRAHGWSGRHGFSPMLRRGESCGMTPAAGTQLLYMNPAIRRHGDTICSGHKVDEYNILAQP